jgi:hypothetical protein
MAESLTSDPVSFVRKTTVSRRGDRRSIAVGKIFERTQRLKTGGPHCLRKKRTISEIRDNVLSVALEFGQFL